MSLSWFYGLERGRKGREGDSCQHTGGSEGQLSECLSVKGGEEGKGAKERSKGGEDAGDACVKYLI